MSALTHTKHNVSTREIEMYIEASNAGISPPIVSLTPNSIQSVEFTPLLNIPIKERKQYCEQLMSLMQQLHELGIFHCDVTEENMVVDIASGRCYIIDFGLSRYMKNYLMNDTMIQELKQIEYDELKFICGISHHSPDLGVLDSISK